MTIQTIERLIGQLLEPPTRPLRPNQKRQVYDFAAGLFVGRVASEVCDSPYNLVELQAVRALAAKQSFYLGYFAASEQGRNDAQVLGCDNPDNVDALQERLLDIDAMRTVDDRLRKAIATQSAEWAKNELVAHLAQSAETDASWASPVKLTVHYDPDVLFDKAAGIQAYRAFYRRMESFIASEPDAQVAAAERAVLELHVGRLHTLAATDVFPGLLALETQLAKSQPSERVRGWQDKLGRISPAIAAMRRLSGDERAAAREAYSKHLDAIRQGAPFELDEVDETEASLFTSTAFEQLTESLSVLGQPALQQKTQLGEQLEKSWWGAEDIRRFMEMILARWDMLSGQKATWAEVDDRKGFAPDQKFQVLITPHRKNMSVDSTRRVINIPAGIERPLAGLYPAGALPLIAHELTHVLQAYADYEMGQRIPLARMKGRRYRILREAGGVYQEYVLARDYFGAAREPNGHYVRAYRAKMEGVNRAAVARVFYESFTAGKVLNAEEDLQARELAVNRTSRLYRYGGHASQALDYVEQFVVCSVLLQRLTPEQVNLFLLAGSSFNLEDSVRLHEFGLYVLPRGPVLNPAEEVIRSFMEERVGATVEAALDPR